MLSSCPCPHCAEWVPEDIWREIIEFRDRHRSGTIEVSMNNGLVTGVNLVAHVRTHKEKQL